MTYLKSIKSDRLFRSRDTSLAEILSPEISFEFLASIIQRFQLNGRDAASRDIVRAKIGDAIDVE